MTVIALLLRQHDVDFEHLVVVLLLELDLDVVRIDLDVFRDDLDQVALQVRQEVGTVAAADVLAGDDQLQALLGDRRGTLLLAEQVGEQ